MQSIYSLSYLGFAKLSSSKYGERFVPKIRFSGQWIEQLGFNIGDQIVITGEEYLIKIQPLEHKKESTFSRDTVLKHMLVPIGKKPLPFFNKNGNQGFSFQNR